MKSKIYLVAFTLCIFGIKNTTNAQFSILLNFTNTIGPYLGATPQADQNLISIGDGYLYGITSGGGAGIGGTVGVIFKVKPDGTEYTILKQFDGGKDGGDNNIPNGRGPNGSLYFDGTFLYATTVKGGTNGTGTIVKIKPDGTGFAKIYEFDRYKGGTKCTLVSDGTFLYGNNFKIKPDGTGYADFAYACTGSWLYDGTFLYGLGYENSVYGQFGTVFKVKPDGTGYVVLSYFDKYTGKPNNNTLITDGTYLYGACEGDNSNSFGCIFKVKTDGTDFIKLFAGIKPKGRLTMNGTDLYGMTREGGKNNMGTIFKITAGVEYSILHSLNLGACYPSGSLLSVGNTLYGMTASGGSTYENRYGGIIKYELQATGLKSIYKSENIAQIYPNPSNGNFIVEMNETSKNSNIEIYNTVGQKLYSQKINASKTAINTSLKAGTYYIRIVNVADNKMQCDYLLISE